MAETLDSLTSTLEAVRATLTAKRARLGEIRCRRFLCAPDAAGRVECLSMQHLRRSTYLLFAGYSDGRVRQWDVQAEAVVRVFLAGREHDAKCMCFGGDRMFTAGEGGTVQSSYHKGK